MIFCTCLRRPRPSGDGSTARFDLSLLLFFPAAPRTLAAIQARWFSTTTGGEGFALLAAGSVCSDTAHLPWPRWRTDAGAHHARTQVLHPSASPRCSPSVRSVSMWWLFLLCFCCSFFVFVVVAFVRWAVAVAVSRSYWTALAVKTSSVMSSSH